MQQNNNGTTNWSDVINKDVLSSFSTDISLFQVGITMSISFLLGLFIYTLYKRVFSGVLYSKNFNVTLVALAMITSLIIMAIGSNLILSLGMVGALSIVRFRTPIKDPADLIFLFWALATGIITGAGFYSLAILGSILIGLVLFIFMKKSSLETPYLFVVNFKGYETEEVIFKKLKSELSRFDVKQKSVTAKETEITFEIRLKGKEPSFVNSISNINGVENAILISYNGDYVQ
ncbi:DUF4956 domain-containing protein [Psychrobacillus soli]|uniref:DUF4956 domain-containing protein n=1 Tax=Psychrobacillus soli TaxID=1543965 RepID=A0A544TG57_9BACI|nr:DUF4956 domain-containing protein [Psychrobacillus soli]TQR16432.1 DUF4956 domain-containing protein [Psychrobacillus soli]